MKKKPISVNLLKDANKELQKLKLTPDDNGVITFIASEKLFEIGSLNHLANKEYYFSYEGAISIAQDYSRLKRDEAFGVWETKESVTGKLYVIAYRGEIFLREVEN